MEHSDGECVSALSTSGIVLRVKETIRSGEAILEDESPDQPMRNHLGKRRRLIFPFGEEGDLRQIELKGQ